METLVDDVGSFPLPSTVGRETFNKAYVYAREAFNRGQNPAENDSTKANFYDVVLSSFRQKLSAGLDVVNYPQQYDGIKQVGDVIHKAMDKGTFVVEEKDAFLPEVKVIQEEARRLSEEFDKKILLRISLFGPMEHYLKEIGTVPYAEVLDDFAETICKFAKNSVINTKYIKTEVVSIDEPSFGHLNIAAGRKELCEVLQKAFNFSGVTRQIHLHSSAPLHDLLSVKNIDVLSFEYAASPKNIENITKGALECADKRLRVGISRTDIDDIYADLYERGFPNPSAQQLAENPEVIRKRYDTAKEKFGDTMTFTGPDCGLGGWPNQEAAQLLLQRTVRAVKDM
jgi:5-methyltetrahydropteroyltriglutamate--homocysteine methyltransferase